MKNLPRNQEKLQPHKWIFLLVLVALTLFSPVANSAEAPAPEKRSFFSFLGGTYLLDRGAANFGGIGAFEAIYGYSFMRRLSAMVGYSSIQKASSGFGSLASGFDFGVQYCFFSCAVEIKNLSDVLSVTEYSRLGLRIGAGLGQRSFQATSATIGYSGPYYRAELNYFLNNRWKALAAFEGASFSNVATTLSLQTFTLGIGFDFGIAEAFKGTAQ